MLMCVLQLPSRYKTDLYAHVSVQPKLEPEVVCDVGEGVFLYVPCSRIALIFRSFLRSGLLTLSLIAANGKSE